MEERDVITWTVMIGGIVQHDFGGDAYDMFIRMQQVGFKPDALTYVSILNACASARALEWVMEVHNQACEAGFELDLCVGNALVHMYAKCGSISFSQNGGTGRDYLDCDDWWICTTQFWR
jgi:pentatricopeptide repeat protein